MAPWKMVCSIAALLEVMILSSNYWNYLAVSFFVGNAPTIHKFGNKILRRRSRTNASDDRMKVRQLLAKRRENDNPILHDKSSSRKPEGLTKRSNQWVVLVDDEEAIRNAVGQLLRDRGYQVIVCGDGHSALNVTRNFQSHLTGIDSQNWNDQFLLPDAMVCDIRMPGMDGLQVLHEIRHDPKLMKLPVILLTAKGLTIDRIAGYDAGADAYIPKPFDPEELLTVIDNVISRKISFDSDTMVDTAQLEMDLHEIKQLLLYNGGGGVGNGWIAKDQIHFAKDESTILELLCKGLSNKEIANQMFFSTRRVEQLLTRMYRKANVKNRTEMVRWSIATGRCQI
jgi:DNA-binding NarL/FixJ family response regulator